MDDEDSHKRLNALEDNATETKLRLGEMDRRLMDQGSTLTLHSGKLDQIFQVVTQQGARPQFDPIKVLGIVRDVILMVIAMVAPAATLLVWMITTMTAANDRVQEVQIQYIIKNQDELRQRIGWNTTIREKAQ